MSEQLRLRKGRAASAAVVVVAVSWLSVAAIIGSVTRDGALVGRTWYLESVTRDGRTWSPLTDRPSTLTLESSRAASTNDGINDESWTVALDGPRAVWTSGGSTAVAETAATLQVYQALGAILGDHPTWAVADRALTWTALDGSTLTYGRAAPPGVIEPDAQHGRNLGAAFSGAWR